MLDTARMTTYPHHSRQVWTADEDYPAGEEEAVAAELETWAARYGVAAVVKHEPGRVGMTTGGWSFPIQGRIPKMPEGTEPLWGHWLSGKAVGIHPDRHKGITTNGMVMKLRALAQREGWGGTARVRGGHVWVCIDPRKELTEVDAHRKIVSATVGLAGRTTYPWERWDTEGIWHEAVMGVDFAIGLEPMRRVILNRYRRLGRRCETRVTENGLAFMSSREGGA